VWLFSDGISHLAVVVQKELRRGCGILKLGRPPVSDPQVLEQLHTMASRRPTYSYRRLWVLLNRLRRRQGLRRINAKRMNRLSKGYRLLLQRYTGTPPVRIHDGVIAVERSDERYCSDGFEIGCANGERVRVAFSLDCCDRQAIAFAATTAGYRALRYPSPNEFRDDNLSPMPCPGS
jgi:putative transposase